MHKIRTVSDISKTLRAHRKEQNITQQELGDFCNLSRKFIVELEAGKPTVRLEIVLKVIQILGLHLYMDSSSKPNEGEQV